MSTTTILTAKTTTKRNDNNDNDNCNNCNDCNNMSMIVTTSTTMRRTAKTTTKGNYCIVTGEANTGRPSSRLFCTSQEDPRGGEINLGYI